MSAEAYFIWGIALIGFIGSTVILHKNRKRNGDVSNKGASDRLATYKLD